MNRHDVELEVPQRKNDHDITNSNILSFFKPDDFNMISMYLDMTIGLSYISPGLPLLVYSESRLFDAPVNP